MPPRYEPRSDAVNAVSHSLWTILWTRWGPAGVSLWTGGDYPWGCPGALPSAPPLTCVDGDADLWTQKIRTGSAVRFPVLVRTGRGGALDPPRAGP